MTGDCCRGTAQLGLQLGRGGASICSVYPAVTPYKVVTYTKHIRLTPYELLINKRNSL